MTSIFFGHRLRHSSLVLGVCAILTGFLATVPSPAHAEVEDLQKCLARPNTALNVLVLMDKSGSMKYSDSAAERATMVGTSLKLLASVASSQHKYSAALLSWGGKSDGTNPSVGWSQIDSEADADLARLSGAAKANNGNFTDWSFALQSAREMLEDAPGGSASCRVVLWMTDGALDVNNNKTDTGGIKVDDSEQSALANICGVAGKANSGAIDWFRRNNILILGALLQKGMVDDAKPASDLFRAVVEGKFSVDTGVASKYAIPLDFSCGSLSGTLGEVVDGVDASDLAWKFIDLVAQARGLTPLAHDGQRLYVDPGLGRVIVYSRSGGEPSIKDASGRDVCVGASCVSNAIGGVLNQTTITNPQAFGDWSLSASTKDYAAFGQISVPANGRQAAVGLVTQVSGVQGRVFEGERKSVSVKLLSATTGQDFPLGSYESAQVCFTVATLTTKQAGVQCQPPAKAAAKFSWSPALGQTELRVDVKIRSARGPEFTDHLVVPVQVEASKALPQLNCDDMRDGVCYLSPIGNKGMTSITNLSLVGGEKTATVSGWACTDLTEGDPFARRYDCTVQVSADSVGEGRAQSATPVTVSLKFAEPLSESEVACDEDAVTGSLRYTVAYSGREITREQAVAFCTLAKSNPIAEIFVFILLLLLGVGLPLLAMLLMARRAAVFEVPDGALRWTKMNVRLDGAGLALSVDGESKPFNVPKWDALTQVEGLKPQRSLSIGDLTFTATPPSRPFVDAKFDVKSSNDGAWLMVNGLGHPDEDPGVTGITATSGITGMWLVRFSDSVLDAQQAQEEVASQGPAGWGATTQAVATVTAVAASGPVDAELFLFVDFTDFNADLRTMQTEIPNAARWGHVWEWIHQERKRRAETLEQSAPEAPAGPGAGDDAEGPSWGGSDGDWDDGKPSPSSPIGW